MEAILLLQETLIFDQLVYAVGAALTRGRVSEEAEHVSTFTLAGKDAQSLAAEWRALEAQALRAGTAFQVCDLVLAWERHFSDTRTELRVVGVREHGELVLVWPLVVETTPFGRVACWAGDPIGQYGDVIAAKNKRTEWIDAAFREIGCWADVGFLRLSGVRADGAIAGWAARRGKQIGEKAEAPVLDMARFSDLDAFLAESWPQAKRNAKRMRKFTSLGGMDFEVVTPGPRAAELVAQAFDFKRDWLVERGLYGRAVIDNRTKECLVALAGDEKAQSGLAVSCLSVGGEVAAIEIGFRRGGRHYAYMGSFSPDFAKHSPGFVVTELTIRNCVEAGLDEYDPLPPADDYKLAWSNRRVAVRDYGVVLGWSGYPALVWTAMIRPATKALYERLPLKLRRGLRPS
jgi:CelD/BcsL family acetyltransferase involved in cellulose biosynthesis